MRVPAPAKLNLFLHVTGRRADGFHDLETVFQLIDLCDEVEVRVREDGRILRDPAPTDPLLASLEEGDDLTVRAARLLQQASGTSLGASLHVTKRIPAGAGLGGGSSDAASVLRALNHLWKLGWSAAKLADLGLQLGSDVPVFVHGRSGFARGRGEQLTPLALPPRWYLVIDPGVAVSTREVFAAPELTRDTAPLKIAALPADGGRNDCEPVVRSRHAEVARALDWLAPCGGRLTGTGGCVFAADESSEPLHRMASSLPSHWRAFVVKGLDRSPVLEQ
jgi:4-diphosphocytidyl-2-C-methyl-D-erythritol kinase